MRSRMERSFGEEIESGDVKRLLNEIVIVREWSISYAYRVT